MASRHPRIQVPRDPDVARAIERGRRLAGPGRPRRRCSARSPCAGRKRSPTTTTPHRAPERSFSKLRAARPEVAPRWREAANDEALVACPVVTLELLLDARDSETVERAAHALDAMRQAPVTRSVTDAAIWAVRELARRGSAGAHRVRVPDALVAAAAAERGLGVLHYDVHFDRLASVLAFRSQWVASPGSIS